MAEEQETGEYEVREEKISIKKITFQEVPTLQKLIEVARREFEDFAFKDITLDFNESTSVAATGISRRILNETNPSLADAILAACEEHPGIDFSELEPTVCDDRDSIFVAFNHVE